MAPSFGFVLGMKSLVRMAKSATSRKDTLSRCMTTLGASLSVLNTALFVLPLGLFMPRTVPWRPTSSLPGGRIHCGFAQRLGGQLDIPA